MNFRMMGYTIGQILRVEGVLMLLPLFVSLLYGENIWLWFLIPAASLVALGTVLTLKKPEDRTILAKEGLVIVGLSWVLMSLFGCLPFWISGEIPLFIDALFETISGFTTTGASVLSDVESLSYGMLFWRSFTHWIGGMGVLVFVLAILPQSDVRAMHLFRAETTGPKIGKLVSKMKSSARILYGIYIALTAVEMIFLLCGGMNVFDSVTHAFATAGTGGFSTKNAGIAHFDSLYIEMVIAVFMFLFGINFQIFYLLLIKNFRGVWKNEELRWYFVMVFAAVLFIALDVMTLYENSFGAALRYSFFQVTSVVSTTGFATTDYAGWPLFSRTILLLLMFSGACAGSTAGGLKVSRVAIAIKSSFSELRHMLRPRSVVVPKFDGKPLEREEVAGVQHFLLVYALLFAVSLLLVSIGIKDFDTAFSGVLTMLSNVGPGLSAAIGPVSNFGAQTVLTKLVFGFDMLAGRLELFPIIILFAPATWRRR